MSVLDQCLVPTWAGRYWRWFGQPHAPSRADSGGKFLYFARDPELLYGIAVVEIHDHGFKIAKVCNRPNNGKDFVLCLYAENTDRLGEVEARFEAEYGSHPVVFRGWKSNALTARQGRARGLRRADPVLDKRLADWANVDDEEWGYQHALGLEDI